MSGPWTTIYRWGGVTHDKVAGLVEHEARDAVGVVHDHSNPNIDYARIGDNVTMVNDGAGGFRPCVARHEWTDFIEARVEQARPVRRYKDGRVVPVALRKDASVVMDFILQLDPDFTGPVASGEYPLWDRKTGEPVLDDGGDPVTEHRDGMTDEQKAETARLLMVMVDEVVVRMGAQNVVGWSIHWDETSPHVHLMAVPLDDDNQIRIKSFYPDYGKAHDPMRERLRDSGYNATMERWDVEAQHLGPKKYRAFKEQRRQRASEDAKAEAAAREREAQVAAKVAEVNAYVTQAVPQLRAKAKAEGREEGADEGYSEGFSRGYESGRSEGLAEAREAAQAEVAELRALAEQDAAQAALERERAAAAGRAAARAGEALRAHLDRLEAVPADVDRWLDSKAMKDGRTYRDLYDRTAAQRQQRRAETLRIIEQHTSPEMGADDARQLG